MLKRRLTFAFIISIVILLTACDINIPWNGDSSSPDKNAAGTIYSFNATPSIVICDGAGDCEISAAFEIQALVYSASNKLASVVNNSAGEAEREIVIGDTSRKITSDAKAKLNESINKEIEDRKQQSISASDIVGFAVYAHNGSIAAVWSNSSLDKMACEFLADNYFNGSSLAFEEEHYYFEVFSLDKYLTEIDEKMLEKKWAEVGYVLSDTQNGSEILTALKSLYDLYSDNVISWIAKLCDPKTGGFYLSNSGRDNSSFLPDLESTQLALGFMAESGAIDNYGDSIADVIKFLPDWYGETLGNWILGLQHKNGYFYHPQWGGSTNENITTARRNRDLSSAKALLKALELKPKYNYPGTTNTAAPASHLTAPVSVSKAIMVSKVVNVNEVIPTEFQSEKNFSDYLMDMKKTKNWYQIGNELQSYSGTIKTYQAKTGYKFDDILFDFLEEYQRSDGLWDPISYAAVNSYHKISWVYNSFGRPMANIDSAADKIMYLLSSQESTPDSVMYIYNAWSCIPYIIDNIKYQGYNSMTAKQKESEFISDLCAKAPELINRTKEMVSVFKKFDQSFSYTPKYSTYVSQGHAVAVKNTVEGDLLGTTAAIINVSKYIFASLGIGDYYVPVYTESDMHRFSKIITALGSRNK